jgi:hypothetical protein
VTCGKVRLKPDTTVVVPAPAAIVVHTPASDVATIAISHDFHSWPTDDSISKFIEVSLL